MKYAFFLFLIDFHLISGGLRKGGAPLQIKWGGGPFLYTLLYHVLSALAIKRNNAFHK